MSEEVHPRADELDDLSALDFVRLMHEEDVNAVDAISPHLASIARAVEAVADRLRAGGRLHYFGAGTSGLVAAMDAAECPATFGVSPDLVQAHTALEPGQEDDRILGQDAVRAAGLRPGDVAVGVSASGRTAFVLGALEEATGRGALTVGVTCNPRSRMGRGVDIAVDVETGPEVIAGSTRLKSGTAQKLILNMLSTAVFTRLGHTHRGRMVGVVAANDKLRDRAARIVADLGGLSLEQARTRLDEAGGDVRAALQGARRT
jgi:N-acetylmuramic acid 6-phosphate etherase